MKKKDFKVLFRSRSWEFMKNYNPAAFGRPEATFEWKGRPIFYRPGTSDPDCIYTILLKGSRRSDYFVPEAVSPSVILDIGANIGITSIYLAERFPKASIHAFEPVPQNFSLLERNLRGYPQVRVYPMALGETSGTVEISLSAYDVDGNYGGFSFDYEKKRDSKGVRMERPADYLPSVGIERVDLIKIDTEGHEYKVLRSFDPALLSEVRWIIGELHGVDDFLLLDYLSKWFDVSLKKTLKKSIWMFNACNKAFLENVPTPHQAVVLGRHRA